MNDDPTLACEYVTIEVGVGDRWTLVGSVADVEPPASFAANGVTYIAGWIGDDGPSLWESPGCGFSNSAVREITTIGLQRIADLRAGQATIRLSRPGGPLLRTRFQVRRQP